MSSDTYVQLIIHIDLTDLPNWQLIPLQKSFKYGRFQDEKAPLPIIKGGSQIEIPLQGISMSNNGVEGFFKYDFRHISTGKVFAQLKFEFNREYDSELNIFTGNIRFEGERVNGFIKFKVTKEGESHGYTKSALRYKVFKTDNASIHNEIKQWMALTGDVADI